mmetsp:Transcript_69232/g.225495  ORF Transcript_69232/g.225495 Transcript_69232/m.225495 type:complete len:555 (+) Transcript_69232:416-2080(+)
MLASSVCLTVIDPFTFQSSWVVRENVWAANAGIPIVPVFDADRFRWGGQLDRWARLYPFVFIKQAIPLSKGHRRESVERVLQAVQAALEEGIRPPEEQVSGNLSISVTDVRVGTGGSRETVTVDAIATAYESMLARLSYERPSLIVATFTCAHDAQSVVDFLEEQCPEVPVVGCTTCRGVLLNDTWLSYKSEFALACWGICDDAGDYKVVHIPDRPEKREELLQLVCKEVQEALMFREDNPSFVVLLGCPGHEEVVLEGLAAALGETVPILGGSAADNSISGLWRQLAKAGSGGIDISPCAVSTSGLAIALAWCSVEVATSLVSGFQQTAKRGKVTKVDVQDHGRTIMQIDGKPPRQVYDSWSGGQIGKATKFVKGQANILGPASFCPLGEPLGGDSVRVMHPAFLTQSSGALTTFADAYVGMEVVMLTASPETMIKNLSQSARQHIIDSRSLLSSGGQMRSKSSSMPAGVGRLKSLPEKETFDLTDIAGALMIFCGGLVMALEDHMPTAAESLAQAVGHSNIMAICCFGEQGMITQKKAVHGNLMFGSLVISK